MNLQARAKSHTYFIEPATMAGQNRRNPMTNSTTNSAPRYILTRTGMTRPEMASEASFLASGCVDLPEAVSLVELGDEEWDGNSEYGQLTYFVLSDDEDYLADTLPDGLLPTGANYVMIQGMYARVDENPDYRDE